MESIKFLCKKCIILTVGCMVLSLFAPSHVFSRQNSFFKPYTEIFPQGRIDWDSGMIYGVGRGYFAPEDDRMKALAAGRLIASGNIVKLVSGVRFDDRRVLGEFAEKNVTIRLKAFVKHTDETYKVLKENGRKFFEVTRIAPIKGVKGLTAKMVDHLENKTIDWPLPSRESDAASGITDDTMPWLVLDARKIFHSDPVNPAISPKIMTRMGDTVYSSGQVSRRAFIERGMARYVTSELTKEQIKLAWNNDLMLFSELIRFLSPSPAHADEKNKKKRKRQKFIVKNVKEASGILNTNLIISAKDAKELREEDSSSRILKNCRVIIVAAPLPGGIEGMLDSIIADTL